MSYNVTLDSFGNFGSTKPEAGPAIPRDGLLVAGGWAGDGTTGGVPHEIFAIVDGTFRVDAHLLPRPDVARHFGNPAVTMSGFSLAVPADVLAIGRHEFAMTVVAAGGARYDVAPYPFYVTAANVADSLDLTGPAGTTPVYLTGHMMSKSTHDFIGEPRFAAAMQAKQDEFKQKFLGHGAWNFHILLWCATHAMHLPGDFVQCGVFNGGDAAAIVNYTNFGTHPEKKFYLLDTFTGVPEEAWSDEERRIKADGMQWLYNDAGDRYESVVARFRDVPNVRVVRGKIPETLAQVDSQQIAALFLDLNNAAGEKASLEYFWDRIVPGGVVFSDDYGHGPQFREQKLMTDRFAAEHGLEVLCLPTGNGVIVKP